jgi:hypothetical protein
MSRESVAVIPLLLGLAFMFGIFAVHDTNTQYFLFFLGIVLLAVGIIIVAKERFFK